MKKMQPDLRKVLTASPKTKIIWEDLTPLARRDFIFWIDSSKQVETRKRRIESLPSRLASGKRRPCCFTIVPMNLYATLNAIPKAKAVWKDLTPIERRDFIDWINSPKVSEERAVRIAKACSKLAAGKRHP